MTGAGNVMRRHFVTPAILAALALVTPACAGTSTMIPIAQVPSLSRGEEVKASDGTTVASWEIVSVEPVPPDGTQYQVNEGAIRRGRDLNALSLEPADGTAPALRMTSPVRIIQAQADSPLRLEGWLNDRQRVIEIEPQNVVALRVQADGAGDAPGLRAAGGVLVGLSLACGGGAAALLVYAGHQPDLSGLGPGVAGLALGVLGAPLIVPGVILLAMDPTSGSPKRNRALSSSSWSVAGAPGGVAIRGTF